MTGPDDASPHPPEPARSAVGKWAVIGGGMAGVALALSLADRGASVTLYEASDQLGGLAASWESGGIAWDRYYHVILRNDRHLLELLERVGLRDTVRWRPTSAALYDGRSLHPVGGVVDSLRLPGISLLTKARFGLTLAVGLAHRRPDRLDHLPVTRWLRRWSGRQGYERVWAPLLRAKLGGDPSDASATLLWATIHRLASARRAGVGQEELGHLPGGAAPFLERLRDELGRVGVDIRLATPVTVVRREPSAARSADAGVSVRTRDGAEHRHDRCVITLAAPLAARLCPELVAEDRARLLAVPYRGVVCASLLLRRPLAGRYLTYLTDPDTPFTAVVEMTALTGTAAMGGNHLVYLPRYVRPDDPLLGADDAAVRACFVTYLRRIHPDLQDDEILAFEVARTTNVFAVPAPGALRHPVPVRTSIPGVHLVGSAHITDGTLNVNETLATVAAALPMLLADRQHRPPDASAPSAAPISPEVHV